MSTHHGTAPQGRVVITRRNVPLLTVARKVCVNGNSTTVSLPPFILRNLNLLPGDWLALALDADGGGFVARVLRRDRSPDVPSDGGELVLDLQQ